ncbi:hypothetical protein Q0N30_19375 [Priestia megaterium]|uniref:hypothetical protein n=1 Tax=Priestia megaterium TaxID=1404 RepID=UPI003458012B
MERALHAFSYILNLVMIPCSSSDILAKSIADEAIYSIEASCSSVVADTFCAPAAGLRAYL